MHFFCSVFFEAYIYTDEFVLETIVIGNSF
jgi:hypothetical protein